MIVIYKKELHSYFHTMSGYLFIALILLFIGLYTSSINLMGGYGNFEYVLGSAGFIYILIVPILSMRVLAEERRHKTDQILLTSPVSIAEIVAGKYFAMITVLLLPILVICAYPLILSMYGAVPMPVVYGSVLGFFFMGAALIAVGMFISSLLESQLIAAVVSFGVLLLTYMMDGIAEIINDSAFGSLIAFTVIVFLLILFLYYMTHSFKVSLSAGVLAEAVLCLLYQTDRIAFEGSFSAVLKKLAFYDYLRNFVYNGIFDLTAIIFYLTVIFLFLFFTVQSLEMRRWN